MTPRDQEGTNHKGEQGGGNGKDLLLPVVVLPPPPPQPTLFGALRRSFLLYAVIPALAPPLLAIAWFRRKLHLEDAWELHRLVSDAGTDDRSVDRMPPFQNPNLLAEVYRLPSARRYVDNEALEWQKREGYCGSATMRCVLASYGDAAIPRHLLPEQKGGESSPDRWCAKLTEWVDNSDNNDADQQQQQPQQPPKIMTTRIVQAGDVSYDEFLAVLRNGLDDDERSRVAVNYLRSALFGFNRKTLWWHPTNYLLGLFGGHFSPILGILDNDDDDAKDDPWVAVFDVNHKYGGTYLVPATRLYQAVLAQDVTTRKSRAVIVVTLQNQEEDDDKKE